MKTKWCSIRSVDVPQPLLPRIGFNAIGSVLTYSAKAAELVVERISDDQGMFEDIVARTDIPKRTDFRQYPPL